MTEAKKRMPLYRDNLSFTERQYKISKSVIELAHIKFFQVNFDRLKTTDTLRKVQKERWSVEEKLFREKLLKPDELIGLQLATSIAYRIDLIYYHKLKGNYDQLKTESEKLKNQINDLLKKGSEFKKFLKKYPLWKRSLKLIKRYASNQTEKTDDSNKINRAATLLAKEMGQTTGPKLFFVPEEEDVRILGDGAKKKTFVPQLLFTIPVNERKKIFHPLGLTHKNLFYEFVILQAGSALRWEQSALAIDGGALFLLNNFISNYEKSVDLTFKAARKHKIQISKSEIWQTFIDLLLYHEIGHSNVYTKADPRMGIWTEWLANSFMYSKSLKSALGKERSSDREKILFMLLSQVDLSEKRLRDQSARQYINSELLFLHLLEKNELINFEDSSFYPSTDRLNHLIKSIVACRKYENLKMEGKEINEERRKKLINFWQNYFDGNDK